MIRLRTLLILASLASVGAAAACRSDESGRAQPPAVSVQTTAASAAPSVVERNVVKDAHGEVKGLHNLHQWCPNVWGSAQPEEQVAFDNMKALGIRTVLSVDGGKPDQAAAERAGLRYVHVPIGYDGIDEEQARLIAKAVATSDGPVLVHCHHGKHRGPAAAAIACVATQGLTNEQAQDLMRASGTDPKYVGLWKAAREAKPVPGAANLPGELTSYCAPGDLAMVMVEVDARWDNLKACRKASWGLLPDHPDVSPPHEARMLWEHFRELARRDDSRSRGDEFVKYLTESERAVEDLEAAIRNGDKAAADKHFDRAAKLCSSCHASYRDK